MTDSTSITDMLKQLGWGSGFKLPIANEENKELEKLLELKQSKLVQVNSELQETSLAVDNCAAFFKHMTSKIQHGRDVEAAKRGQFEKEEHLYALALREQAKTEEEAKNTKKRLTNMKKHNKTLEGNVLRRKDILDDLVDTINFDKRAITEYENKFKKEDAYLKLIEDFGDADKEKKEKFKKLYQQLGERIVTSRMQLDRTISESEVLEGELDGLAKRFRKAHSERNQFIENWKETLKAMEGRDKELINMKHEYNKAQMYLDKSSGMLEKQEAFYENIRSQSKTYTTELNRIERIASTLQSRKMHMKASEEELSDAISELANFIFNIEKEIKAITKAIRNFSDTTNEWKMKAEKAEEELKSLKEKYAMFCVETVTSGDQVKQMQEFLENEEKKYEALKKELMKHIAGKSAKENIAHQVKNEIILAEVEARNLKSSIQTAQRKTVENSENLLKSQTVASSLDIEHANLDTKLRGLENPELRYSAEDYNKLMMEMSQLKESGVELSKADTQLRSQISHWENIMSMCQRDVYKESEENRTFELKLNKMEMELRRIGKDDTAAIETIKDAGVTNSLLHVQLKRMLQSMRNYEEKMLDLEQEKATLHAIVKARQKDIETYYALLMAKKRAILEEAHKMKGKVNEVTAELDSRKRKYEMIKMEMWSRAGGGEEDGKEDGKGKSEAYFIIKMAQERESYRQEGDKWDERVKEAEKVVEGLQNTLSLLMKTNDQFKESLKPATINTPEGQILQEIKEREYKAAHNLSLLKAQRKEWRVKLQEKQSQLDRSISEKNQLEHGLMERQYDLHKLVLEVNSQKEKIRRATQQANKVVKELSQMENLDKELLQNDMRLRVTKEKYDFASATLERLLFIYPYLVEDTLEFLTEKGMHQLREKILRKLIATSMGSNLSSLYSHASFSAQSSVRTSRSMSIAGVRQSRKSVSAYGAVSERLHKSVVFQAPTGAPEVQKVLENIKMGMDEVKKVRASKSHPDSQMRTSDSERTSFQVAEEKKKRTTRAKSVGISFGELRKVLQDAVDEQQQDDEESSPAEKVEEDQGQADGAAASPTPKEKPEDLGDKS